MDLSLEIGNKGQNIKSLKETGPKNLRDPNSIELNDTHREKLVLY